MCVLCGCPVQQIPNIVLDSILDSQPKNKRGSAPRRKSEFNVFVSGWSYQEIETICRFNLLNEETRENSSLTII